MTALQCTPSPPITAGRVSQIKSRHINVSLPLVVGTVPRAAPAPARYWQPAPSAPQLQPSLSPRSGGSPAGTWGRSPGSGGSPAGTWGRSPRHSPAPDPRSASAPALPAAAATPAPSYEPPPSYEQVMQGRPITPSGPSPGGNTGEKQWRREKEGDTEYTHLGNL